MAICWAKAECERQQIDPTIQNMRLQLGSALSLIRFPRMSVKEFGIAGYFSKLFIYSFILIYIFL